MKRFRALAALLLAILAAAAWFLWIRVPKIETVSPHQGPAMEVIYATGIVEPQYWIKAGPTIPGRITEMNCEEGNKVTEGMLLARLDSQTAEAKLAEAAAVTAFRREEYERLVRLHEREVASEQALERARSELLQAEAARTVTERALADLSVRSPLTGIVLRREGEVGQVVQAGEAICWVGEARPLHIVADVDEEDRPRVKPGQEVLVRYPAYPGDVFKGRIRDITPKGDPFSKSYRVYIDLTEEQAEIIGMTAEVNIVIRREEEALLIPILALDEGHVWLVEKERLKRRPVEIGIRSPTTAEVLSGLQEGDVIARYPQPDFVDGMRINPAEASPWP